MKTLMIVTGLMMLATGCASTNPDPHAFDNAAYYMQNWIQKDREQAAQYQQTQAQQQTCVLVDNYDSFGNYYGKKKVCQ